MHVPIGYMKGRCKMKIQVRLLTRQIARIKGMLERANDMQSIARLTSLLIMMQTEYIHELEKQIAPINKRKVA